MTSTPERTLERSHSARSDRTVDESLDLSSMGDFDEVEAVQPISSAAVVRAGRRAGRARQEELADQTLDLSASFDQLDTSQLELEPVRPATAAAAVGGVRQLALEEVQAVEDYDEDFLEESLASIPSPPVTREPPVGGAAGSSRDPLATSIGSASSGSSRKSGGLRQMQQSLGGRQGRPTQGGVALAPVSTSAASAGGGGGGGGGASAAEVARLTAELRETREKLAVTEVSAVSLRDERDGLQRRLREAEARRADADERARSAEASARAAEQTAALRGSASAEQAQAQASAASRGELERLRSAHAAEMGAAQARHAAELKAAEERGAQAAHSAREAHTRELGATQALHEQARSAGSKWPSWRGHSWPPRARQSAFESSGLPSALVMRGPSPRISPGGRGCSQKPPKSPFSPRLTVQALAARDKQHAGSLQARVELATAQAAQSSRLRVAELEAQVRCFAPHHSHSLTTHTHPTAASCAHVFPPSRRRWRSATIRCAPRGRCTRARWRSSRRSRRRWRRSASASSASSCRSRRSAARRRWRRPRRRGVVKAAVLARP